jgi:ABC-type nitrate/sulfonate/bicarbonate transport system ATPase subunit
MSPFIRFRGVSKAYRRPSAAVSESVLQRFSLDVDEGELIAIVGASGIGKTTLLHLAAGLELPDAGAVETGAAGRVPRLGMVFQQPRLFDWLTVIRNIDLAVDAAGADRSRGRQLLEAVGLAAYAQAFPLSLSGGQRQRVALARAFAIDPEVVLLDEAFSALDELTARRLRLLLQDLWISQRPTGLLVTHNTLEAAFLADRVVVLGGPPARILDIVKIGRARPRTTEDPALFELHRRILAILQENSFLPGR